MLQAHPSRTGRGEFRAGWRYLLGAFLGIAGGFSSLFFYSQGVFLKPLAATFGWTRGEASLGAVAISVANVIALPLTGRIANRVGAARVGLFAGLWLSLAFVLMAWFTHDLASFLVLTFLLTALSAGSTQLTFNSIIVKHFRRSRGLALGLAMFGTGVGASLVPPVLTGLVVEHGWRAGYLALAVMAAPLALLAAPLLREDAELSQAPSAPAPWGTIALHPALRSIGAIIVLASAAVLGTTMHIVPLLTDRGMAPVMAGTFAAALGVAVIFGRVFTGILLDRFDAGIITAILLLLGGCGVLLLAVDSVPLSLIGAILIGFGMGTEADLLAFLLGRHFAQDSFVTAYGIIYGVHAAGVGLGGYLAGVLFDLTGDYTAWLLVGAGAMAVAALVAIVTERGPSPMPA